MNLAILSSGDITGLRTVVTGCLSTLPYFLFHEALTEGQKTVNHMSMSNVYVKCLCLISMSNVNV